MKTICQSTIIIACIHLEPLRLSSASATRQPRKKKFYKHHFLLQWSEALKVLEVAIPLLSLCFDIWKADLTLRWVLQDEQLSRSAPLPHVGPSHPLTPSNLSHPPSSLAHSPSSLAISSHPTPPSSVNLSSLIARPSHIAPPHSSTSSNVTPASHAPLPISRHASMTAQPPPPRPRPADKAAGLKAEHRHNSSPPLRTRKQLKGSEDTTSSGLNAGACAPHIYCLELTTL